MLAAFQERKYFLLSTFILIKSQLAACERNAAMLAVKEGQLQFRKDNTATGMSKLLIASTQEFVSSLTVVVDSSYRSADLRAVGSYDHDCLLQHI